MTQFKRRFSNAADGRPTRRIDYLKAAYLDNMGNREKFIEAYENSDLRYFAKDGSSKDQNRLRSNAISEYSKHKRMYGMGMGDKLSQAAEFIERMRWDFEGIEHAVKNTDKEGAVASLEFIRVHLANYGWVFENNGYEPKG